MRPYRVGAVASFVLAVQFLLTLVWIIVSWPPEGLSGLVDAMGAYYRERVDEPFAFAAMNLYNCSFGVTALTLAVVLRRQFSDYPLGTDFAVASITAAATMYVASGVVPLIAAPPLAEAGDEAALRVVEGVSAGLLLAGTMASGFALVVFGVLALNSRRLPTPLCLLIVLSGSIEIVEWGSAGLLVLDPIFGTVWTAWLGSQLWADRVSGATRVELGAAAEGGVAR
ncbi:MAG: hypothetical protein IT365_24010 [Candidatus Hydrogenedentes bacterium]|nr:hypothetical protein [Candidatus Hydrogenedentota bacterium]